MSSSHENLSPQVLQCIARELRKLVSQPTEGITVHINEEDLTDIQADIDGPVGTPYEGGTFRCKLVLGSEFPSAPPRGFFLTKIFHPNVASNGDICVNTLKKDWKPDLGMTHIFQVIRCLLIVPFPESALNEDASKLFLESYDEYAKRARLMTSIHASRKFTSAEDKNKAIPKISEDSDQSSDNKKRRQTAGKSKSKGKLEKKKSDRKRNLKRL
eukprot:CAMPEP_0204829478 /NCGR_PEP_ID=MMETSP1346-20131115/7676_1 /ASSEMBLY_ACC=CAM_ASM_000771 /TAXON_ID=215587 /ORGANISM="Aplanochytrium stocchinoi, Strain GSBS06" /LENGTH=213 /DNA_ID=CAMNT_0051959313 /DNA_START=447 /DNA_END=1088 /DNA_ORIENTATION=+